jgi:hypothetical protein
MNTWWGLEALKALGEPAGGGNALVAWLEACQLPGGGFTWQPKPELAGVDDVAYTWAALRSLKALGGKPAWAGRCAAWLHSLRNPDGGYGDRPGRQSNPVATFQALDSLGVLGMTPRPSQRNRCGEAAAGRIQRSSRDPRLGGSPLEAVDWRALVSPHGARTPSRLDCAPAGRHCARLVRFRRQRKYSYQRSRPEAPAIWPTWRRLGFGAPMADPAKPVPWHVFRDQRIGAVRKAGGVMIWQFNENEELTRVLLDEAVEMGTYAAVSQFHFGNENFLNTQPFLMRYQDVLPFVALQDAHTRESCGGGSTGAFAPCPAREPGWEGG